MKKNLLFILITALIILGPIFGQGLNETTVVEEATFSFTDSLGRVREINTNLERIAPSGNVAQVQLYTIANDLMVGNSGAYSESAKRYLDQTNINLPTLGAFYGKKANLNKEALIVADPQVVIDFGEIKGSKDAMAQDLDTLEKQINIPVVFIETYLRGTAESYRLLGTLLNRQEDAEKLAQYSEKAINKAIESAKLIKTPVRVYYSSAADALDGVPKGNFHSEVIDLIGAENVVPATSGSGANLNSLEQIFVYNPEVILLSSEEAYKLVTTDKTWGELEAVKNGKVIKLPIAPYPWIDSPPSVNRIIGIYYLGSLLYPELYSDIDLTSLVKEFYSLFYKYNLTDTEVNELLGL